MLNHLPKDMQLINGRANLMGTFLTLSFFIYKMWMREGTLTSFGCDGEFPGRWQELTGPITSALGVSWQEVPWERI